MLRDLELPQFEDFEFLGSGASATVVKATHKATKTPVAIKLLNVAKLRTSVYIMREITTHRQISHPFIVDFYGCLPEKSYICYCQEFVPGGSLLDRVNRTKGIPEPLAKRYFCQLMSALRLLHEHLEVVHRDIKLENLLIDENDNLKMIDFGFVSEQVNMIRSQCGSIPYTAPEVISAHEYSSAVDMWSAGVVLYAMLTGTLPFRASPGRDVADHILRDSPVYPLSMSPLARDLIDGLLTKDPMLRLTLDQVRTHPWVTQSCCSEFISDAYLNEVTNTMQFEPELLRPFPAIDAVNVQVTLDSGMDDDDTITYMILKHFSKMKRPSYCGVLSRDDRPRSSIHPTPTIKSPSMERISLMDSVLRTSFNHSQTMMPGVHSPKVFNMSRGGVGRVIFRVRSKTTESTNMFDLESFKQTFVQGAYPEEGCKL